MVDWEELMDLVDSVTMREEFKARQKSRADGEEHWHDSITGCKDDQFTIFAQPKSGLSERGEK